jgi:hypothetical protein
MIRIFTVAAVGVVLLLGAAGCSASMVPNVESPSSSSSSSSPSSSSPRVPIGLPDGVVGTAPITATDGKSIGTVQFRSTSRGIELELPAVDFGADPTSIDWTLADSPFSPTACGSDNVWEIGFPGGQGVPPLLESGTFENDPSFFTQVVVVRLLGPSTTTGCEQPIIARGPITWTIPVQRPWVHPKDAGARTGADGTVTLSGSLPGEYTTARGDSWGAIAGRFGITSDDLAWLNPNRLGGSTPGEAYAQQRLNLDPKNRGNSESRRPR